MIHLDLVLMLVCAVQDGERSGPEVERCSLCHGTERVGLDLSVHVNAGLRCVSCHGGDPSAEDPAVAHGAGFRGLTDPVASVLSCGECHADLLRMRITGLRTDQLALYRTSKHGTALFAEGNTEVATCADCHGGHDVRRSTDRTSSVHPRNQPETCGVCHSDPGLTQQHDMSADVSEAYRGSVHGRATLSGRLGSPSCSTCHGHHGASPPGAEEARDTCASCHSAVFDAYESSPHFSPESDVQCVTCHGSHGVTTSSASALVGAGPGSCDTCHGTGDDPARGEAAAMYSGLQELGRLIADAEGAVGESARRGLVLRDGDSFLGDARNALVRAHTATHSARMEAVEPLLRRGNGFVRRTDVGLEKLGRVERDRRIFGAAFFGLTIALGVMLLMYAREIRGPSRGTEGRR